MKKFINTSKHMSLRFFVAHALFFSFTTMQALNAPCINKDCLSLEKRELKNIHAEFMEILKNNSTAVGKYFEKDISANYKCTNCHGTFSALSYAIKFRNAKMLKLLIEYGADVNEPQYGSTALIDIALNTRPWDDQKFVCASVEIVKILLKNAAHVNAQDQDGNTPLHYAALNRCEKIVELLVQAGADRTIKNNKNQTPLGIVCAEKVRMFGDNPPLKYRESIVYKCLDNLQFLLTIAGVSEVKEVSMQALYQEDFEVVESIIDELCFSFDALWESFFGDHTISYDCKGSKGTMPSIFVYTVE